MDYKLIYQDRFTITGRGDCITININDNKHIDIQKGDTISELVRKRDGLVDNVLYEVTAVETFMKSFGIIGDNRGVLIKPIEKIDDDLWCEYSGMPSPKAYIKTLD
jgi:hypothetical protein